jgi:hypothetical protein
MSNERGERANVWIWWLAATSLLPLSFLMWWAGLEWGWSDQVEPLLSWRSAFGMLLIASPFVALAGLVWIVALCIVVASSPGRRKAKALKTCLPANRPL